MASLLGCVISMAVTAQTPIGGEINSYARVLQVGLNWVRVNSTSGFTAGEEVLIYQAQGATMSTTNNATFGDITSLGSAGNYEVLLLQQINGDTLKFECPFERTYSAGGATQVVNIPRYIDAEVTSTLTAPAWDGQVGGILALKVEGTLTLSADIDMSGRGFPGGQIQNQTNITCGFGTNNSAYSYPINANLLGARKGQGIASLIAGSEGGRGKQVNGGGGANDHNAGGGGGGNGGQGGMGGRRPYPRTISGIQDCAGNNRGIGGASLSALYDNTSNRIYFGGGGGSGHGNNVDAVGGTNEPMGTGGGAGGGLVFLSAGTVQGNNHSIYSNGVQPLKPIPTVGSYNAYGDGAGGGGAGGTVLLNVGNVASQLTVEAKGGKGGDHQLFGFPDDRNCMGTGGGGGGGVIWFSGASMPANVTTDLSGGARGEFVQQCAGTDDGSLAGSAGLLVYGLMMPTNSCPLPVEWAGFQAQRLGQGVLLSWTTAQEENNRYFVVERSEDGKLFYPVGQVGGSGTKSQPTTYLFTDHEAPLALVYYRIRQVDFDGRSSLTAIRSVAPGALEVSVYPNPAGDRLYWRTDGAVQSVELWSTAGRLVFQADGLDGQTGFSVATLPEGVYFLLLRIDGLPLHERVVIAR